MKTEQISQQSFMGTVQVLGQFSSEQEKALKTSLPALNELVKDKDFDLFIKRNSFGETIVGTDVSSGYVVGNDNDFAKSASLALRDKLQGSYLTKKMQMIKKAIEEFALGGNN